MSVPTSASAHGAQAVEALNLKGEKALEELEATMTKKKHVDRKSQSSIPEALDRMMELENRTEDLEYNIAHHLPGPLRARDYYDVLREVRMADDAGANYLLWDEMQRLHCKDGAKSNFVLPAVADAVHVGKRLPNCKPYLTQQVILAHPEDCERIARTHVKKNALFGGDPEGGGGIIFTRDNDRWRELRHNLSEAFHPMASLQKVFPRVVRRAEDCAERLAGLANEGAPVNLSEFYLHETLAQLMLGLFGFPENYMDATNKRFRDAMSGKLADQPEFVPTFLRSLLSMIDDPAHTAPSEGLESPTIHGPLSRVVELSNKEQDFSTKIGNVWIFAFAGHDTTGHTLTWLSFELAKRPDLQRRLQDEVDSLFARLGDRPLEYKDLTELKFMTRCIMEALRLWPAVANGTFRELEHDDWVHGEGGEKVHVPKGTFVMVTTWMRHHDPELWGPDAHNFNPDRDFKDHEIWDNRGIAAFNPATERFSPFTFAPRDCIGKNFAQSEMRAILCFILRRFSLELPEADSLRPEAVRGVNFGTMGPLDTSVAGQAVAAEVPGDASGMRRRARFPVGLNLRVVPRQAGLQSAL